MFEVRSPASSDRCQRATQERAYLLVTQSRGCQIDWIIWRFADFMNREVYQFNPNDSATVSTITLFETKVNGFVFAGEATTEQHGKLNINMEEDGEYQGTVQGTRPGTTS